MGIHISSSGRQLGPFSPEETRQRLAAGEFQSTDLAWTEGLPGWVPLSTLPGFAPPPAPAPAGPPAFPQEHPGFAGRQPGMPARMGQSSDVGGQPLQTSGLATASLICGILAVTVIPCFAAIVAIICGHMAKAQIKKSGGTIGGDGLALAGLIMGYLGTLVFIPILAALALPAIAVAKERANETLGLSNARQIVMACEAYAVGHNGAFPPNLQTLVPEYLPTAQVFRCPIGGNKEEMGFVYYPFQSSTSFGQNPLLFSKGLNRRKQCIVAHVDGSAALQIGPPPQPKADEAKQGIPN